MATVGEEIPSSNNSRVTENGRMILYRLEVIQQPERARACGSGAKSHADRRPIDPPPIIKLRVFDNTEGDMKDVTFTYSATFFLFATLETARPLAVPRGGNVSTNIPVLTGGPVSGMAYLDRPSPAGYFLFPDLSIRHEGMYRLKFSLYENPKEGGMNSAKLSPNHPYNPEVRKKRLPLDAQHHCEFRAFIHTDTFNVFSAKKFPGLSESTNLSKCLSDQGCRVRIRRDVRLRRPKAKTEAHIGDVDDETEFVREHASASPTPASATIAADSDVSKTHSAYSKTPATSISDGSKMTSPTIYSTTQYHRNADGSFTSYPLDQQQLTAAAHNLRAAQSLNDMRAAGGQESLSRVDIEEPLTKRARIPHVRASDKIAHTSGGSTPRANDHSHETSIEVDSACVATDYCALDDFTITRKRQFTQSFNSGSLTAPLADGARPPSPKDSPDMEAASSSSGEEQRTQTPRYHYPIPLEFRRAAGDSRNRSLPGNAAVLNIY